MNRRLALTTPLVVILIMLVAAALIPPTASAAGLYSKTITINPGQVPSTQTDFPLLISLANDNDLKAHVSQSNGADIYFTDSSGTTLYSYEVENYNSTTGTLVAWVKIPSLSNGTVLKMWYGGSATSSPSNVWSNGFQGVWHMKQVSALDSTANHNDGTVTNGSISSSSGKIGVANGFINNPPSGYMDCGAGGSLSFSASGTYTWSAWVNTTGTPGGGGGIIGKSTKGFSGYDVYLKNGNGISIESGIGGSSASKVQSISAPSSNEWHHIVVTYDNQSVSIYLDGTIDNSGALSGMISDSSSHIIIGFRASHTNGTGVFNGSIDEVRYSTEVKSADWIRTEYNNQNNPGVFYTVSGETVVPTASPTPTPPATRTLIPTPTVSRIISPTPTCTGVCTTAAVSPTPTCTGECTTAAVSPTSTVAETLTVTVSSTESLSPTSTITSAVPPTTTHSHTSGADTGMWIGVGGGIVLLVGTLTVSWLIVRRLHKPKSPSK